MEDRSEETRAIYHAQHQRIVADERAMSRFVGMFSCEYFGLPADWFAGKSVLDAGCGDTAKLLIALHGMGCRDLHGFDLGEEFIPVARTALASWHVPPHAVHLRPGNLLDPPYEPESFDFVACHGVMVHLNSLDEVRTAFAGLARLVKPGGYLYTVYGSVGGLLEGAIFPAIRQYYRDNADFRRFIDELKPEHLMHFARVSEAGIAEHEAGCSGADQEGTAAEVGRLGSEVFHVLVHVALRSDPEADAVRMSDAARMMAFWIRE